MGDDIVTRLRNGTPTAVYVIANDAADQIERLWALADQLADALGAVRHDRPSAHTNDVWAAINHALITYEEARRGQ